MKELSKITVLYINGFFCQKPLCTMIEIFICPLWQSTIFYSFQIARDFVSKNQPYARTVLHWDQVFASG